MFGTEVPDQPFWSDWVKHIQIIYFIVRLIKTIVFSKYNVYGQFQLLRPLEVDTEFSVKKALNNNVNYKKKHILILFSDTAVTPEVLFA